MVQILRSLGLGFRPCGPLTVANWIEDPSFQIAGPLVGGRTPAARYTFIGQSVVYSSTNRPHFAPASGQVITATGGVNEVDRHGFQQTLTNPISQGETYTFGCTVLLTAALPAPLTVDIDFFDIDNVIISTETAPLILGGVASPDWTDASYSFTVPYGTESTRVTICVKTNIYTSTIPNYYVDGMMWNVGNTAQPYVNGDFAGFVWQTDAYTATLQSALPTDLRFFADGSGIPTPIPIIS